MDSDSDSRPLPSFYYLVHDDENNLIGNKNNLVLLQRKEGIFKKGLIGFDAIKMICWGNGTIIQFQFNISSVGVTSIKSANIKMENLLVKRVRFSQNDILIMLREIVACNPFQNTSHWKIVHENLNKATNKNYSLRTIKSQSNNLVLNWIKEERRNRAKSGIEELYTEKDDLLQNIFDLMKQFKHVHKEDICKKDSMQKGQLDRDIWAASKINEDHDYEAASTSKMVPEEHLNFDLGEEDINIQSNLEVVLNVPVEKATSTPTAKKANRKILRPIKMRSGQYPIKKNAVEYLENKHEIQLEIRRKELELEQEKLQLEEKKFIEQLKMDERKILLEEKKFAAESAEKEIKLKIEKDKHEIDLLERKKILEMLNLHQKCIVDLLNKK